VPKRMSKSYTGLPLAGFESTAGKPALVLVPSIAWIFERLGL
jgi:hypothetical protein